MPVDLNNVDLRRPDPNYKSDPAARGDVIKTASSVTSAAAGSSGATRGSELV